MGKVPTIAVPIFKDPTIIDAIERHLAPYSGKALERRQQAIVAKWRSAPIGTSEQLIAGYILASDAADPKGVRDD